MCFYIGDKIYFAGIIDILIQVLNLSIVGTFFLYLCMLIFHHQNYFSLLLLLLLVLVLLLLILLLLFIIFFLYSFDFFIVARDLILF